MDVVKEASSKPGSLAVRASVGVLGRVGGGLLLLLLPDSCDCGCCCCEEDRGEDLESRPSRGEGRGDGVDWLPRLLRPFRGEEFEFGDLSGMFNVFKEGTLPSSPSSRGGLKP